MDLPVRLSCSFVGEAEAQAVQRVIEKGFLGMGPEVGEFESELQSFLGGSTQVVCVNTGTSALHLGLQALGLGVGDEVLVPTITYVASFQAISATGATPVACDVLEDTVFINLEDAQKRITSATKAIMPVHYAGASEQIGDVYSFAEAHNLRVVEDAAHAFGGMQNDSIVGSQGDIVCFSFDGIKNITSGEGGAVCTRDAEIADKVRDALRLGVHNVSLLTKKDLVAGDFDILEQGWRYHMSDLMAAIGRVQLSRVKELSKARVERALAYNALFETIDNVRVLNANYGAVVPHIYPIFVAVEKRDLIRQKLSEQNIQSGLHYKPNHLHRLYNLQDREVLPFPVAEHLYESMLTLPLQPLLSDGEQEQVFSLIKETLDA